MRSSHGIYPFARSSHEPVIYRVKVEQRKIAHGRMPYRQALQRTRIQPFGKSKNSSVDACKQMFQSRPSGMIEVSSAFRSTVTMISNVSWIWWLERSGAISIEKRTFMVMAGYFSTFA